MDAWIILMCHKHGNIKKKVRIFLLKCRVDSLQLEYPSFHYYVKLNYEHCCFEAWKRNIWWLQI